MFKAKDRVIFHISDTDTVNNSKKFLMQVYEKSYTIDTVVYEKCVITIQLNTLTDVPYQMTVGRVFVYVCERDRVKDFVYITHFFPRGPRQPRYNGVAVYSE